MWCSGSGSVQVQHPGAERLMMVDIRNMQAFALFLQKYDINFDMFSATKEMEKQVCIHSNSIVVSYPASTFPYTCP
jgi:serine/threonine-protein kinase RIO1